MQDMLVSSRADFESLPPAVQRKFFSNVERFRLLTTQHPSHHAQPRREFAAKQSLSIRRHPRARVITPSSSTSSLRHYQQTQAQRNTRQKLRLRRIAPLTARDNAGTRHNRPLDNDLTVVHEYLQCFHSLPPKIQKTIFSQEERRLLQKTAPIASNITDAADQALLKFEERHRASRRRQSLRTDTSSDRFVRRGRRHYRRSRSSASPAIRSSIRSSIRSFPSSLPSTYAEEPSTDGIGTPDTIADPTDSGIEMEESILDSFRWLDEDEDLDLSLDSYHKYVADTALSSQHVQQPTFPRRMPSLRRTLSLAKNRNSMMFMGNSSRGLSSSQSSTLPFSTAGSGVSNNRPDHHQARHISHRSTSSIDPAAQYYQDPEARLKLRVYLASPQKFDEAIEFGFPSLDHKENIDANNLRRHNTNRDSKRISQISASTHGTHGWTFLDDETTSIDLSLFDLTDHQPQFQQPKKSRRSHDKTAVSSNIRELTSANSRSSSIDPRHRRPQPLKPVVGNANGNHHPQTGGHRREMTLKMTLTRPDLRTAGDSGPYGHDQHDDPLRLAELPPADESCNIWDDIPEERGVVKKMWRKLRYWRD
ncbi:hypothetical protein TMatcc_008263 [Talaromyces marneffei ATCC 18224]|nr:hypothetical protein EYB25_006479 [Talaromyces marneffei]